MGKIVLMPILVLRLSLITFAQDCPKFKINTSPVTDPESDITFSASYEGSDNLVKTPLKWTIIANNQVTKQISSEPVNFSTRGMKSGDLVLTLAEETNVKCANTVTHQIYLTSPIPHNPSTTLYLYPKLIWSKEKFWLDVVATLYRDIAKDSDAELIVYIYFENNEPGLEIKSRYLRILNYLSKDNHLDKKKILFVISENDRSYTRFEAHLRPMERISYIYGSENHFVIHGDAFEKIERLFQTKPIAKKRKN